MRPNDLPLLVSLSTLLEVRNVTHAARRLHMSQPALSAQLARLRTLFNDPLLVPSESGRGMVATPKALLIAEPLREALQQIDAIGRGTAGFDPDAGESTFHLMGDGSSIASVGERLVQSLQHRGNLAVRLRFSSGATDLLERFEQDNADVLLGPLPMVPPALRSRRLFTERYVALRRRGHPDSGKAMTLDAYCDSPHVAVHGEDHVDEKTDACLHQAGARRTVSVIVPRHDMLPTILAQTDLVATVPASLARRFGEGIDILELPFIVGEAVVMAWHRRHDGDARHQWLRSRILESYEDAGGDDAAPAPDCAALARPPQRQAAMLRRQA